MDWTKLQNKHTHLLRMSNGVLEAVGKLHLNWCVAIAINGSKFGGWVSENYLALARLARWFFSLLPFLTPGPPYRDPTRPLPTWSVKELRDWLRVRGLPSVGKKADLMSSVEHYTELDVIPPILPPSGGSMDDVVALTRAMGVAIANIMQRTIDEGKILRTKWIIKRFLNAFHRVDCAMLKEGDKPTWLTSYNFLCLLNVPSLMECYGPISNIWEGGYNGEQYSQELKHRLKGGLKDNWHKNVLEDVLNDDCMKRIELPQPEPNTDLNVYKEKLFNKYPTCNALLKDYRSRAPISVINIGENVWGVAISKENIL